ncbi:CBS domain-containing protein [Candidatus Woesearchaeota archaeon]|nr:CBS domain-containing protein [Candidatus Woesearchaeota archaeon]
MKVKDIMDRKVPKLHENDAIGHAISILVKVPYFALPVLNKEGKYVGELSQRKLLLIDIGKQEFKDDILSIEQIKMLIAHSAKTVKEIMDTHNFGLIPEDDVFYAAKLLYDQNISSLPVLDKKGKLLGVLTDICVLKHYKGLINVK